MAHPFDRGKSVAFAEWRVMGFVLRGEVIRKILQAANSNVRHAVSWVVLINPSRHENA